MAAFGLASKPWDLCSFTAGKCSRRKLRAARRNLRTARSAKRLKRVRGEIEDATALLRPSRQAERHRLEDLEARSRSRIAALLPQLEADPVLGGMVELLKPCQAADGVGPEVHGG